MIKQRTVSELQEMIGDDIILQEVTDLLIELKSKAQDSDHAWYDRAIAATKQASWNAEYFAQEFACDELQAFGTTH